MSGGVDSAVAAARLCDAGYAVVGVTLHLWDYPDAASERTRCCAPEDAHDARRVADHLGIPHYTFDRRELFLREVVEPFVAAYLDGTTPSPCVRCNRGVKMRELFELADRLGAVAVATGHYARVGRAADGTPRLLRARDHHKDQSYFLHTLAPPALARLLLPLGTSQKAEVRAEARVRGLPGAHKGESQELCFVPATSDYAAFVAERAAGRLRPGPVVDGTGRELGRHDGVHHFTVGQRKGLGIALGEPAFVTRIEPEGARVVVGPAAEAEAHGARVTDVVWRADVAVPTRALVKVRSQHAGVEARVERGATERELCLWFERPLRGVSPGQVAVAYRDDEVLGGGTIASALGLQPASPKPEPEVAPWA
ncbi:MAG: tRNA 2-thiouridine(34) synthase MnmA [Polyangiaceae bacterium]|nr:tRNA 2-thiouridine(34) synthase MnmA [Polyangiaceae bacterium]